MNKYSFITIVYAVMLGLLLAACSAINAPTPVPTVVQPTATPAPTATAVALPTLEAPFRDQVVNAFNIADAEAIAYVQNEQLFIRTLPDGQPIPVEAGSCVAKQQCMAQHLKWSPDGQYLLFYSYSYDGVESASRLHVSDRQGNVQTINDTAPFYPGAWSPDGRHIAFMRSTDIPLENPDSDTIGAWQYEVWRVPLTEAGTLGAPQLVGPWTQIGDGCGGGGRSLSETLYEYEGGTSYGYLMGIMVWTPQDILLHTFNCDNIGIGRYDLAAQTELPGFVRPLRNLVLNASGDRWYAITDRAWSTEPGSNELVTGTPDSPEVTVIPTSAPLELLFMGQFSGNLYYTERTALGREEISDRGLFFAYYQSALWRIRPDGGGEEQLLFGEDDHAYAQVTETAVGDLLFVLVENERPLFAAAQDPQLDTAALTAYYPQRHIMQLPAAGGKPVMILTNAGQPALTFP